MRLAFTAPTVGLAIWWTTTPGIAQDPSIFERLDKNKDGVVSADEVDREQQRLFERLVREGDQDADGKLTKEEFAAALRDRPRDGRANPQGDRPAGKPDGGLPTPREVFARFDKNGDGKLDKEEVPDRMRENFDRLDTSRDGSISLDELRAGFAAQQRRDGEGRGPNPEMLGRLFDNRDRNRDGKLTKDELPEERREFFERLLNRFDDDGNGLTKERFLRAAQALSGPREAAGDNPAKPESRRGDAEGRRPETEPRRDGEGRREGAPRREGESRPDGEPRRAGEPRREGEGRRPAAEGGRPQVAPLFAALDTDRDGEISAEELAHAAKSLGKLDRNGDGKITRDELAPMANRDR